jgi:hypothetical protein
LSDTGNYHYSAMLAHRAVPGAAANAAGDGGLSRMLRCNTRQAEGCGLSSYKLTLLVKSSRIASKLCQLVLAFHPPKVRPLTEFAAV